MAKLEPEHGQLTDEFCIAEERGLIRSKREKTAASKTFSEIQAEEVLKRQEASLQRAAVKRKLLEQQQQARIQQIAQKKQDRCRPAAATNEHRIAATTSPNNQAQAWYALPCIAVIRGKPQFAHCAVAYLC